MPLTIKIVTYVTNVPNKLTRCLLNPILLGSLYRLRFVQISLNHYQHEFSKHSLTSGHLRARLQPYMGQTDTRLVQGSPVRPPDSKKSTF